MTDNDARRDALATWFLEFSVLWAVFPVLERIIQGRPLDFWVIALSAGITLTTLIVGVMLKRGDR